MKLASLLLIFSLAAFSLCHAQDDDFEENEEEEKTLLDRSEIGLDLAFNGSNFGGNFGIGLKYAVELGEYFVVGPSFRYERVWWKSYQTGNSVSNEGGYNVWGGGAFAHARFFNALFIGAEFEMLKSPYDKGGQGYITSQSSWAPTLLLGGGFSMEFKEVVRLNVGVMYDIINAKNSPYRNSYPAINSSQGGVIYPPILYRFAFFFPLGR